MAESKHVVRKISPDKLADFDEHWWPVTLLLLVTAGCLIGSVYFHPHSDFTTHVWYRNAWVQIGMLAATGLLLIIGVAALKGDAQRRLQLGIFLSLLFHAGLLFSDPDAWEAKANGQPCNRDTQCAGGQCKFTSGVACGTCITLGPNCPTVDTCFNTCVYTCFRNC